MDVLKDIIRAEKKANAFGFVWSHYSQPLAQIMSECDEVREAIEKGESRGRLEEEVGDLLNAALSLCLYLDLSPDEVLHKNRMKYEKRVEEMMRQTLSAGLSSLRGQPVEVVAQFWKNAKAVTG